MVNNPFQDGISVVIDGDSGPLNSALDDAKAGLLDLRKSIGLAGGAIAVFSGVTIAGAIDQTRKFNDALANVQKVTSKETAGKLRDDLMRLNEEIPISLDNLTKLAEQAGKFGATAPDEIEKFVETVGKIQTATDLSAEVAGQRFAKIAGALGMPLSEIDKLGNAVNKLADSFKTDADEITDTAVRVSNTLGQQLGLGEDQVISLSATMNEVSPSAELAASSLRRAAESLMNPKKVKDISKALGMKVDEFRKMRDENPMGLMRKVASAMNENGSAADRLRGTIGKAATDFSKLGTQLDRTDTAQKLVNKQFKNGTSLQKEMDIRTKTLSGRLELLKGKIQNVAIVIGEQFMPHVIKLTKFLTRLVETFAKWNNKTDGAFAAITLIAGAVGGLVVAAAALLPVFSGITTVLGLVGTALGAVTLPIAAVVAAVIGLAYAWKTNLFGIRDHTMNALGQVQKIIGRVLSWITKQWNEHGTRIMKEARKTWNVLSSLFNEGVKGVRATFAPFINWFSTQWDKHGAAILETVKFYFDGIKGFVEHILDALATLVVVILRGLRGDVDGALDAIDGFFRRSFNGILDFIEKWNVVGVIRGVFHDAGRAAGSALQDAFNAAVPSSVDIPSVTIAGQTIGGGVLRLPQLAAGGFIESEGLAMLHAGERVIPAAQVDQVGGGGGGGGVTVNIDTIEASGRREGRLAARSLTDELRSRNFN